MADITMGASARPLQARWFYVGMAATCVLIAFGGFVPTYWAKLAQGSFGGGPLLHWHGMLFFGWTLFFLAQTVLVATGQVVNHRNWGLLGISLATAMAISVVVAAIRSIKVAEAIAMGDDARRFAIVSLSGLVLFVAFFTLAIVNVRKAESHKRYMLVAMVPLMQAAIARIFMTLFAPPGAVGPPPVFVALPPGLLMDGLIVAGIVYDWRTRGKPHPIYIVGLAANVAVQVLCIPLAGTTAWMSIARAVESIAG
ncbi:MAG: hypothetical protein ABI702_04960 [Burkholderiales bacterium]